MKFKKGNPGKPKGAKNRSTLRLREAVSNFLADNFEQVKRDAKKLSPKDRCKLYCDLLQYGLPRLQAVTNTLGLESLTEESLNMLIDKLTEHANEAD